MSNKLISVDQLAELCSVDRETIRRWRKQGVKGTFLEATDNSGLRGKPIYFTHDAIRKFAEANPKIMTFALTSVLKDSLPEPPAPAPAVLVQSAVAPDQYAEETVTVRLLKERQKVLERELEQIQRALSCLKND